MVLGEELVGDDDEGFYALFVLVLDLRFRCLCVSWSGCTWEMYDTYHGDGDGVGSCGWRVSDCDAGDGEDDCEDDEDNLCDVDAVFPGFVEGED